MGGALGLHAACLPVGSGPTCARARTEIRIAGSSPRPTRPSRREEVRCATRRAEYRAVGAIVAYFGMNRSWQISGADRNRSTHSLSFGRGHPIGVQNEVGTGSNSTTRLLGHPMESGHAGPLRAPRTVIPRGDNDVADETVLGPTGGQRK